MMSVEIIHFRDAEYILREKLVFDSFLKMIIELEASLYERFYRGTMLKSVLDEWGWRDDSASLIILEGRRYQYKGYRNRVAIEANLNVYEGILEGVFRLQIGYDRGRLDSGIYFLDCYRGERSPLGPSAQLAKEEVESLFPTISMPLTVVVLDLGTPKCIDPQTPNTETNNKNKNSEQEVPVS